MANTPQNKPSVFLAPREITKNTLVMTAVVTKNYQVQKGVVVQFYRDGAAIPGANRLTDENGRVDYSISISTGANSVKVKAEIPGNIFNEQTVVIPPSVQGKNRGELPTLVVEDNSLSPTKKRLAMGIFASDGKMIPGRLQLSSNKNVNISFPFKKDQKKSVAKGLQNPGNAHELILDGERWATIDIDFLEGFELDVFVAGWQQKIELTFDAPKGPSKGEIVPMTRPLFAAFCIFLFAVALFSTTLFSIFFGFTIELPTAILLSLAVAIVYFVFAAKGVGLYNRRVRKNPKFDPSIGVLASPVKTNNATLALLVVLTLMSFVLLLVVQWGPPVLLEDNRTAMTQAQRNREYVSGDAAQQIRNEKRHLGLVTDRSLVKPTPVVKWEPFITTLIVFLALFLITIGYMFVAYSDEAMRAFQSVKRSVAGRTSEGVAGLGFFSRLKDKFFGTPKPEAVVVTAEGAQAVPAAAAPASSGGILANPIITAVGLNLAIEALSEFIERIWEKFTRTEPKRRRFNT